WPGRAGAEPRAGRALPGGARAARGDVAPRVMEERAETTEAERLLWGARTWREVRAAVESGTLVALLPVGATEAHGPHLALDADVAIARGVALRAARVLEADGIQPLVLPAIQYSVTEFAAEFPGTVGIGPHAARHVL